MKLKCQPEDFVVTEHVSRCAQEGTYALYRLTKTDIGTLEAIEQIRRSWNLSPGRIAHAGLKDRHAITHQYLTVRNGPRSSLKHDRFQLSYQHQTDAALSAAAIQSNAFEIIVRHLQPSQAQTLVQRMTSDHRLAVPNYYDQQRFGSLGRSGEFVAAAWCRRDYERATWLALADPCAQDRSAEKQQKQILRDHWGDWQTCKDQLDRSHRRSIVTYLVDHPDGFRKAFGLIRPEMRGLYLSAFQSAVWNRMLGLTLAECHPELPAVITGDASLPLGTVSIEQLSDSDATLPLVSARSRQLSSTDQQLAEQALQVYNLRLSEVKLAYPRDRFFARGQRRCWLVPHNCSAATESDDMYTGRHKVRLTFELPAGSYATMLIRCLTHDVEGRS